MLTVDVDFSQSQPRSQMNILVDFWINLYDSLDGSVTHQSEWGNVKFAKNHSRGSSRITRGSLRWPKKSSKEMFFLDFYWSIFSRSIKIQNTTSPSKTFWAISDTPVYASQKCIKLPTIGEIGNFISFWYAFDFINHDFHMILVEAIPVSLLLERFHLLSLFCLFIFQNQFRV